MVCHRYLNISPAKVHFLKLAVSEICKKISVIIRTPGRCYCHLVGCFLEKNATAVVV
jgi:hypothetical protein